MPRNIHDQRYEIRDAVHGFVRLSGAEIEIINLPVYQRLRDIRQLAMGHMVYPGATHTRFEHSLGCLHLGSAVWASLNARQLRGDCPSFGDAFSADEDAIRRGEKLLRLACLLHDLGHPPLSHEGEKLLPKGIDHEEMTARLIRETDVARIIKEHFSSVAIDVEEVIAIATKPKHSKDAARFASPWHSFLNDVLTSELGADRIDYLLRDAHHSGQRGGQFDVQKLVDSMILVEPPAEATDAVRLGLDEGGWLVAEQMVAARYLMYISLYFHKTKRIYEIHAQELLKEWVRQKYGDVCLPIDPARYARLTDSYVFASIFEAGSDPKHALHEFARPFVAREHFRLAKELVLADNALTGSGRRRPDRERLDKFQEAVRISFGDRTIVDVPLHSATKMHRAANRILVRIDEETRYLDDISELVRGMPADIWRARVYAPKVARKAVREFCENWLTENPVTTTEESAGKESA